MRGLEVTDSPAYGCEIRVTVTGGPDSVLTATSKVKPREAVLELVGPGRRYSMPVTWLGYGGAGGGSGLGRVTYR
ncbi:hypothetical protein BU52_24130 [Streptomyces toyocaensis]|uniref:Uncharacterized protein n=1 Tax=Streptomyces toyocaensis TaxID=55952 RepID=A0A081XME0_STRTO|nr:hypothetical protein BU52_24130 [Streptomyces toyocaensis]